MHFLTTCMSVIVLATLSLAVPITDEEVADYKSQKEQLSKDCPKNAAFTQCTSVCSKSCHNFDKVSACFSLRCGAAGCACKEGHIQLDATDFSKGCVSRDVCRSLRDQGKLPGQAKPTTQ